MKRFLIALFILLSGAAPVSAASDPNLYFDSAVFDYYLEKTDTGTKMKVKETYEAVFSENSVSHGITRTIPFTNQDGKNITINDLKITATRNGSPEPIAKTEKENGYFKVNVGSSSRTVQGKQIYVLEYEFKNVITEYDEVGGLSSRNVDHQELYWDTNGTGWSNVFNSVTANVHFAGDYPAKTPAYCYTGVKNSNARDCTVEKTQDGFTFKTTKKLTHYENMTFDIEFPTGTFKVPVEQNYLLVFATVVAGTLGLLTIYFAAKKYQKYAKEKRAFAKNLLTAPQYLPPKNLTVAESGFIWLDNSKPSQTATLLELAVTHKIQLISEKETSKILKHEKAAWKIKLLSSDLTEPEKDIFKILNGGTLPSQGEIVEIKKQTATSKLASLANDYKEAARLLLIRKGLLENSVNVSTGSAKTSKEAGLSGFCLALLIIGAGALTYFLLDNKSSFLSYGRVFGRDSLPLVIWGIVIFTLIIYTSINSSCSKYLPRTKQGLELSNYLDGLKLYITMAEKERLDFNQSAKNAPKDEKGLVRLYEKLLPYACLFGVEESWLKELQKYYENLNYSPDWYDSSDILTYAMLSNMISTTSSTISNNTAWHNSSSSSGFSGGGGGGFSGGGGGGGGGGSW